MLPSLRHIFYTVLFAHFLVALIASISLSWHTAPEPRKPIIVKSVSLSTPKPAQAVAKADPPKPAVQKKQETAVPKQEVAAQNPPPKEAKPAPQKQEVVVHNNTPKEINIDPQKREMLEKLQQTISKIDTSHDTLSQSKPSKNKPIAKVAIDEGATTDSEAGYVDKVAALLKALLKLPEKGDVNIDLTLNRQGKVMELKVVDAKSKVNSIYIEKAVNEMAFPPFANDFKGENKHTFHITLSDI